MRIRVTDPREIVRGEFSTITDARTFARAISVKEAGGITVQQAKRNVGIPNPDPRSDGSIVNVRPEPLGDLYWSAIDRYYEGHATFAKEAK